MVARGQLVLAFSALLALAPPVGGLNAPTAASEPELPTGASALHMSLVGSLALPGGVHGDVWVQGDYAYVGTWRQPSCPGTGVKIVDVSNPAVPARAGTLAQHNGTSQEVMRVIHVASPAFTGDLLAVGLQICGDGGLAGVEFWDVSNPRQPDRLGFFATPGTQGVHELALVQRPSDGRVLALLAVPNSELSGAGGDFRIVDATDPRNPAQLAQWGVKEQLGLSLPGGQGQSPMIFDHSVRANADGTRAYLSYWDAGFIILDIADPSHPTFLGKTSYQPDEEGNAHSVALAQGERLLLGADEDFDASVPGLLINAPPALTGKIEMAQGRVSKRLSETGPVSGDLVYLGRACPDGDPNANTGVPGSDPLLADPSGKIALLDRGACFFALKLARAAQAGAIGAVVVNNQDGAPIAMGGPSNLPQPAIPAVMIRQDDGARIKAALASGTTVNVTLSDKIISAYNDWGYLRLFDISNPANPVQISRFGTAHAFTDRANGPPDDGIYSAHNPIVDGNLVFASWYSDGVRAIDISDPANPREVGYFVPPDTPTLSPELPTKRPMVWGVAEQNGLLFLSDMNYGLWIVRFTPGG